MSALFTCPPEAVSPFFLRELGGFSFVLFVVNLFLYVPLNKFILFYFAYLFEKYYIPVRYTKHILIITKTGD